MADALFVFFYFSIFFPFYFGFLSFSATPPPPSLRPRTVADGRRGRSFFFWGGRGRRCRSRFSSSTADGNDINSYVSEMRVRFVFIASRWAPLRSHGVLYWLWLDSIRLWLGAFVLLLESLNMMIFICILLSGFYRELIWIVTLLALIGFD